MGGNRTDHTGQVYGPGAFCLDSGSYTVNEEAFGMRSAYATTAVFLLLGFGSTSAATMSCGTHEIRDGQIPGQTRAEIRHKCGTPQSAEGDNLYYKKGGRTYRLHFNDSDELESIEEQQE
jgi:hypothetical protein